MPSLLYPSESLYPSDLLRPVAVVLAPVSPPRDVPHLAFPFHREGPRVATVEQDTSEHVMSCENVIVRCPQGFREERPDFGWPFPTFQNVPLNLEPLRAALDRLEPRGSADVTEWADEASAAIRHVTIEVES
jgi:hypothetical protein